MMPDTKSNWQPSSSRWCIFIDILGFKKLWLPEQLEAEQPEADQIEADQTEAEQLMAAEALGQLVKAIFRIGNRCYPESPQRLFVHQSGDGFAIVSDFGEASLERPIAIAVALMRCVASIGSFASAAIAEGEHADISGIYPKEVTDQADDNGVVELGAGLMNLWSVMGTAFIRAYDLEGRAASGPLLTVDCKDRAKVPECFPVVETKDKSGGKTLSVNWVQAESAVVSDIQQRADLAAPNAEEIIHQIEDYLVCYSYLRQRWKNATAALGIGE